MTRPHAPFFRFFFWIAIVAAIGGGFSIATVLGWCLLRGTPPNFNFIALTQAHGHSQILGWFGTLLIGISLFVFPRMTSRPVTRPELIPRIAWLLAFGLLFRIVGQGLASLDTIPRLAGCICIFVGTLGEIAAIGLYLFVLKGSLPLSSADAIADQASIRLLRPFFVPMFLGWGLFMLGNLYLGVNSLWTMEVALPPILNEFLVESFVRLTLLSAVLGFSTKMLPVFLGLREPRFIFAKIGLVYSLSLTVYLFSKFPLITFNLAPIVTALAQIGLSLTTLAYIITLDPFAVGKTPKRVALKVVRMDAATLRGRFGDRGEFGRFELYIFAAFLWWILAALLEGISALGALFNLEFHFSWNSIRHIFFMGVLANMVSGMSLRLLPGLLGARLARPKLVAIGALLLNASAALRVLPLILAPYLDLGASAISHSIATAGLIGLIAFAVPLAAFPFRKLAALEPQAIAFKPLDRYSSTSTAL